MARRLPERGGVPTSDIPVKKSPLCVRSCAKVARTAAAAVLPLPNKRLLEEGVMAEFHVLSGPGHTVERPAIRKITVSDLLDCLGRGWDDFWAMPTHLAFVGLIYPVAGLVMAGLAFGQNLLPLVFPLASGFALVGPLAGIFLYEISRRREKGLATPWSEAFDVLRSPAMPSIVGLGLVLFVIFLVWMVSAQAIYQSLYGYEVPGSLPAFLQEVLTSGRGRTLIVVGNLVGFGFAALVLVISFVAFPLMLDRDVGIVPAVQTSVRAALANPVPTAAWGVIVAAVLAIGSAPLFVGLAVGVPVLGHATWHLYRRIIAD